MTDQVQNIALRVQNFVSQQASAIVLLWAFGVMGTSGSFAGWCGGCVNKWRMLSNTLHAEWQSKPTALPSASYSRPLTPGLVRSTRVADDGWLVASHGDFAERLSDRHAPDLLEAPLAHEVAHQAL